MKLRPHQEKALEELAPGKILCGDVGTGKTLTALAYYKKSHPKLNLLVITTAKKRDSKDWEDEAKLLGIQELTVDSWQNIRKYEKRDDVFLVADEQRLVGSGAWTRAFYKIARANPWILLSATPGDTWMDYVPVFVANGFYKNKTEFVREHVVYSRFSKFPKVERYVNTGRLVRQRNQLLVEMPYARHTTRKITWKTVEHNPHRLGRVTKDRWNVFTDEPIRDVAELFRVARRVVNSDTSRLETVRQLLHVHPRLIVFYNFDYELEMLRTVISEAENEGWTTSISTTTSSQSKVKTDNGGSTEVPTDQFNTQTIQVSEWNGHKHEPVPRSERWVYLVQYQAGSEGWNCTSTDAMVFYSLTYSYKQWHQAFGRIDRLNTRYSTLHYYVLVSTGWIDLAIRKSLKAKKSFNEASFGIKF